MKKLLVIFLVFIFPQLSYSADWSWKKEDTTRQAIATTLTIIDWGQTNHIVDRDDRIELNPILGTHPSKDKVKDYFISVLILQPLVAAALPSEINIFGYDAKPRMAFQYIFIGVQTTATVSNFKGGLRIKF